MVVISVRLGGGEQRRYRFERSFTIGGDPDCDVVIAPTAQRVRIQIANPDVTIAKDPDQKAGLDLNDWRIDLDFLHVLHVGDQLRLGDHLVLFELVAGTALEVARFFGEEPREPDAAELDLLDALRAEPESAEAREVYADWLDQANRCSEAELVRLQWLRSERVHDPDAFSSKWMSHSPRAIQLRLRDLAQLSDPEQRALVSRPTLLCRQRECERRWETLTLGDDDCARRCAACKKTVRFCSTFDEVSGASLARAPVAIDPILVPEVANEAYYRPDREWDVPTNPIVPVPAD